MKKKFVIIKCDAFGEETWRYEGQVLDEGPDRILLEAPFNRPDLPFHGVVLRENDRFVELYFNDRWYNIFEVHDRDDDRVKCWYCNVTRPAIFADGAIMYFDLALDLLVYPDGRALVLDDDEFKKLSLDSDIQMHAFVALEELKRIFRETDILKNGLVAGKILEW